MGSAEAPRKRALWLDCDPGHDDAMAIILAAYHPGIHLLGISTVAGNQTLAKVTQNALDVLDAIGRPDINVVAGQCKPLLRVSPVCAEIHGSSGLDGPHGGAQLPRSPRQPQAGKAVNVMAAAIQQAFQVDLQGQERVALVATGSLTNVALLFALYPEVINMVELTIMGGAMGIGNTGPVAEFNLQTDPEAAKLVFESGVPLTMVPIEVTHTVLVTPHVLETAVRCNAAAAAAAAGTSAATAAAPGGPAISAFRHTVEQLMLFFKDTYKQVFQFEDPPLHDPCAVACVVAPQLFKVKEMRVDIETQSALSAGQSVCDVWDQTGRPKNCRVALSMDVPAFWQLMAAALSAADAASPLNVQQQQHLGAGPSH